MRKQYKKEFVEELSCDILEINKKKKHSEEPTGLLGFPFNVSSNSSQNSELQEITQEIGKFIKDKNIDIPDYLSKFSNMQYAASIVFGNSTNVSDDIKRDFFDVFEQVNKEKMLGDFIEFFINSAIKSFSFWNTREREEFQDHISNKWNKSLRKQEQKIKKNGNVFKIQHIEETPKLQSKKGNKVLFLMDFGKKETDKYNDIKKRSEKLLKCIRIDEILIDGYITSAIFHQMKKSSLNVFDISTLNTNVMFELGYAIALKLPMMIISSNKATKLPFNISGLQCIFFDNSSKGIGEIISKIQCKLKSIK